ncbi:MAG: hypothetical protein ACMG6E_09915, partial [Candidatus Roizmanbacteria bacterium]
MGGKDITDIKKEKIKGYFYTMLKMVTLAVSVLFIISIVYVKDMTFRYFVFFILPFQVVLFIS